jgi:two-component sensor histidine kinase
VTFAIDIARDHHAPAAARRAVERLEGSVDPDLIPEVKLLVSELITNSVKYGGEGAIRLKVEADPPRKIRADVIDQGIGFVPVARNRRRPRPGAGAFISCRRSPIAGASTSARRTSGSRSSASWAAPTTREARLATGLSGHSTSLVEACLPVPRES